MPLGLRLGGGPPHRAKAASISLAAFAVLLAACWLRDHSWESYLYAGMSEGLFRIADLFAPLAPEDGKLPDFSRYHPYHPLLHVVHRGLMALLSPFGAPSALTVAVVLNKLAALAAVILSYRAARILLEDARAALVVAVAFATARILLFGAFSGEAHMVAATFILASLNALLWALDGPEELAGRRTLLAALLYTVAVCFNLAVISFAIVPTALLLQARRYRAVLEGGVLSAVVLLVVFGALPFYLLELESLEEYVAVFTVYTVLPKSTLPFFAQFPAMVSAALAAWVAGVDAVATAARVVVSVLMLTGLAALVRKKGTPRLRLLLWVWLVGFVVVTVANKNAQAVNGVLFAVFPFALTMGAAYRMLAHSRNLGIVIASVIVLVGGLNFARTVANRLPDDPRLESGLAKFTRPIAPDTPTAVLVNHMSIFREVYALGREHGVSHQDLFLASDAGSRKALSEWAKGREAFCLLSNVPLPLGPHGRRWQPLMRRKMEIPPDLYHWSVNHPESVRPVHKETYLYCAGKWRP